MGDHRTVDAGATERRTAVATSAKLPSTDVMQRHDRVLSLPRRLAGRICRRGGGASQKVTLEWRLGRGVCVTSIASFRLPAASLRGRFSSLRGSLPTSPETMDKLLISVKIIERIEAKTKNSPCNPLERTRDKLISCAGTSGVRSRRTAR
jgi:hypothetical protein